MKRMQEYLDSYADKILKFRRRLLGKERQSREQKEYEKLYAGEDVEARMREEQRKKVVQVTLIVMAAVFFVVTYILKGNDGGKSQITELERPDSGSDKVNLLTYADGYEEQMIDAEVGSRKKSGDEVEELFEYAKSCLDKEILGENQSVEHVNKPLNLITEIKNTDVKVSYEDLDTTYIRYDGSLKYDAITESTVVVINAVLMYFDYNEYYSFPVVLCQPDKTDEEAFFEALGGDISSGDASTRENEKLVLPDSFGGREVQYYVKRKSPFGIIALAVVLVASLIPGYAQERKRRLKAREVQMLGDYSLIINKLVLLVSSGMTIAAAWDRICSDYCRYIKKDEKHYAYEEMIITKNEMALGTSCAVAIESFGRRTGMLEYQKMSKLITSNLRHGSKGLLPMLQAEATDSLELRRALVKQRGEEAGTKLLIPMMIMLVIVMALVLVPALSTINI